LKLICQVRTIHKFILYIGIAFSLASCGPSAEDGDSLPSYRLWHDTSIKYAKRFSIERGLGYRIISLRAKAKSDEITDTYIVYDSVKPQLYEPNMHFIKAPAKRIVALSSIYANMISEVGGLDHIVAIENIDYYNNPEIIKAFQDRKIKEVQRNPEIEREEVIKLKPSVIFAFGMNQTANDFDPKILMAGIPVVMSLDHLERSPLARAEWIKFFAAFVNKSQEANIIFAEVEKDYNMLKELAKNYKDKPKVLTELKFGDTWYVPGGKSYMGQLINDANGDYFWKEDTATGSLQLSFEAVYKKARTADLWLNVYLCTTKEQVLSQDKRYADFDAFKKDGIYNNNLNCNKFNYSTYWETGMIYPNRILCDMIQIFHKDAKETLNRPFYYYRKLN
jgi:iron complex transport system substrate-binding protein